jgi:tetratricopeptide (TPR) repeat protein
VALFGARARAVRGDFVEEEGDVILRLVRALDLLPLAIELAAARVRLLSPSAILAKMNHRFKLLTSTGGRPGRHATLRGMLDWSWELLTGQEQQALAQLSVFSGGFSIDAADVVVEVGEGWVLDLLQSLADKSLVRPGERMEMLGCVQEYAAERLDQRGERESTERRHGQFFARYGEEAAVARLEERGGHHHRVARVPELGNLHVAWERAVGRGDGEVAAATALAAWSILELKGPFPVGISMLEACLDLRLARRSRLRVLAAAGRARQLAGQLWEGRRHLEAGIGEVEEHRDLEGILRGSLAVLDANAGQLEAARRNYLAALAIHREVGSRRYEGLVLGNLGLLCHQQGRIEEFASYLQTALPIHREVGNRRSESNVLGNMAVLYMDQGRMEEARQGFEAAIAIAREVGDRRAEGNLLGNLGNLNHNLENYVEAEAQYRESLTRHRQMGNRRYEAIFLGNLGALLADTGRVEEALATDQQALAIHREVGNRRFEGMVLGNLSELLARMGAVEEGRDCLIRGEALLREVEDRLALGKVLCGRATLEAGAGNWALALRAAQEAEQIALALDLGPTSQLRKLLAELDPKLIEART